MKPPQTDGQPHYWPFYCEENVWQLCRSAALPGDDAGRRVAIFISNAARQVALWSQRAALPGDVVVWDYHVVMARRTGDHWYVWDLDCVDGAPLRADRWLAATFPLGDQVRPHYRPQFRVIDGATYVGILRSDRSHMRGDGGQWIAPPPPWECPGAADGGSNLLSLADLSELGAPPVGEVVDLARLRELLTFR